MIERLTNMLADGTDNAMLRLSLGTELERAGRLEEALEHLAAAIARDEKYAAAYKAYGKALEAAERPDDAAAVYRTGIEVAEERGAVQLSKEMRVFLKRIERAAR